MNPLVTETPAAPAAPDDPAAGPLTATPATVAPPDVEAIPAVPDAADPPRALLAQMMALRTAMLNEAEPYLTRWTADISENRASVQHSVRNLAYYLALRRRDLRELQAALRPWGLSSLGRIEAQVMANLDAVIATLAQLCNEDGDQYPKHPVAEVFTQGNRRLEAETNAVFGKAPPRRRVRMMVTLPSEASSDPELVRNMLLAGMNIARINCAHDSPVEWQKMVAYVRAAEKATGLPCKIAMDLGGPKSRTGQMIQPKKHRFMRGDLFLLTGSALEPSEQYPVQVQATLKEAITQVEPGAEVWFDDGKMGTVVIDRLPEGLLLKVIQAADDGVKLKPDKGVNFPGTRLALNPLVEKDIEDLDFIVQHADIINYSFVQTADDIRRIQAEIARRNSDTPRQIALIAKIETARAVENLPELIVAAGSRQPFGVMIARGDLAVEIGFERMAEMQEEILWLCEAAHVPVVWATQVLETLAKEGIPTRAEMTDAAMAERAECVMLNKGKYILDAMRILESVLMRMQAHQSKKSAQLRALRSW